MKKVDIIEEMEAALMRYETIKPEEFYYNRFVSKSKNRCGTLCCLWGWEPKFGILPVKWSSSLSDNVAIDKIPSGVLGWGVGILDLLYIPEVTKRFITSPKADATLSEVLDHWRNVINLLKTTNELDHLLNLD